MRASGVAIVVLTLAVGTPALASADPPPLIGDIVTRRPRTTPTAAAAEGPMCQSAEADDDTIGDPILPDRMGVLLMQTPTEAERTLVDGALAACSELRGPVRDVADPFQVLALLRLEQDLGVPDEARGILVGAWCVETSMREKPGEGKQFLGDWHEGIARASGSFQLHENVWYTTCAGTKSAPHDLLWAASCWWTQVLKTEEKARRVSGCPDDDMLRVAEAASSNVRRYGWRCDSKSAHWQMMELIRDEVRELAPGTLGQSPSAGRGTSALYPLARPPVTPPSAPLTAPAKGVSAP